MTQSRDDKRDTTRYADDVLEENAENALPMEAGAAARDDGVSASDAATAGGDYNAALPVLTPGLLRLMAFAGGASVANMYYCQPLLEQMQGAFRVTMPQVSSIPTLTQAGCAAGMLLFVPMGDIIERRGLILRLLAGVTTALVVAALAPNLGLLVAASLAIGLTSVVPHVIIPFAAQLARPEQRGQAVGTVLGGLLTGILLARTLAGFVGGELGWRVMYGVAAVLMIGLALLLARTLPRSVPTSKLTYPQILASVVSLVRELPTLREAALIGGLTFGAFMAFWTTLVFLLSGAPYHIHAAGEGAGLFGLIGVVGALAAPIMGRVADRRGPRLTLGLALVITIISYGLLWILGTYLWGLVLGVILLDFGIQSAHVSNQTRIYALRPEARSRLNTVYMVTYFLGGVLGTSLGAMAWHRAGWTGVCGVGTSMLLLALLVFGVGAWRRES